MTEFHAKLYSHQLMRKHSTDSLEKFAASLSEAQVELNPHQIEAALFAFKSPFSKGAILADEVGLGKTIEAGIVLSQQWAERKRKIIIVVPSSLRKQWSQELYEKFYLPSIILDSTSYKLLKKNGITNPFKQDNKIIITSYNFVKNKEDEIFHLPWDLVVIDEAHRLRNIYKNTSKIAQSIKRTFDGRKKILLTATPLQNSLLELFGLVSFIDEYTFGDKTSFQKQFSRLTGNKKNEFLDLKSRLEPICKRTLRKDVLEYIKYTNRNSMLQEFTSTEEEDEIYEKVSEYLQRENTYALKKGQKHLITLVARKLLASSSYAIVGTIESLIRRLEEMLGIKSNLDIDYDLLNDETGLDGIDDDWDDFEDDFNLEENDKDQEIRKELDYLYELRKLASSIKEDSKSTALKRALELGMDKMKELGAQEKAVIFTESRRTQDYLFEVLNKDKRYRDKIVLFNGSNNSKKSKEIYRNWLIKHEGSQTVSDSKAANSRAALVDYFRDDGKIMIATEAAAEGINLQFCSMVVNYDLPWNPQRIEQRIGRCHRYGQKHDVVVINFLNKNNEADGRVYELLNQKFKLFDGVFGVSDDVLGSIENGVDFEKRIADIYQLCRTSYQIKEEFDKLQKEMEDQIENTMNDTKKKLLDHFDSEVHDKLKVTLSKSKEYLNKHNEKLWHLIKYELGNIGTFYDDFSFEYMGNKLKIGKLKEHFKRFSVNHNLAEEIIGKYLECDKRLEGTINFDYYGSKKVSVLEKYVGKSGELLITKLSLKGFNEEEYFLYSAKTDDGEILDSELAEKIFGLNVLNSDDSCELKFLEPLRNDSKIIINDIRDQVEIRDNTFIEDQVEKMDKWAEDQRITLEVDLDELNKKVEEMKKAFKLSKGKDKLIMAKKRREIERKRDEKYDEIQRKRQEINNRKDGILDDLLGKFEEQGREKKELVSIKWRIN